MAVGGTRYGHSPAHQSQHHPTHIQSFITGYSGTGKSYTMVDREASLPSCVVGALWLPEYDGYSIRDSELKSREDATILLIGYVPTTRRA